MRIAIFSDTYAPEINGVARTLRHYTTYLEKQGIEYRLFVPNASTPVPSIPQVQRFTSIPFLLYQECRLAIPNPIKIKQSLDEFKPTLIHIATPFNLGLYGLHYGKKQGIPMVASYHTHFDVYLEYYHLTFLQNWIWKYMKWFHHSFEKVYVPSQSTKEKLLSKNIHQNIELWGRGVNHSYYSPTKKSNTLFKERYHIHDDKKILLYVGRIAPEKDIHIVLETYNDLPEHLKQETHLVIVGDGPLFRELSEKTGPNITWTGFMEPDQLSQLYASSDLFLFPSSSETFGNVVLEALSSGLPVIGANAGGVQHLVDHEVTGFLCEPRDIKDFVRYTSKLLDDSTLRLTYSKAAREIAREWSWDAIFKELLASFSKIAERKNQISA
ncbi:glycosyltransferase family 4 protein [Salinibacillus xinjiangensis]|uniref:Glycosyltransferase n=1 Tax=Salinibacillus xinjiangensis TaxID=1229268 RepID=A0A6G1X906_9BACI|nr:glycosyltransferase family 1 protein [Salinibacillus xinjiangensis]MRG87419.1 glycosyltransferase [Salinibacillus xinjiangensis]